MRRVPASEHLGMLMPEWKQCYIDKQKVKRNCNKWKE